MGAFRNFLNWIAGSSDSEYKLEISSASATQNANDTLNVKMLMMASAVGYLASGLAMCRWRTIKDGEEEHGEEYFRLNNRPNKNQSKSEFCAKLAYKLAVENEAVIFSPNGLDLYVADSWNVEERGTQTNLYKDVCVDNDSRMFSYTSSDVMHLRMNWVGLWPLLCTAADEYQSMMGVAMSGYTKQSGAKGVLNIASMESGTPAQRAEQMERIKKQFKEFYSSSSGVVALHSGQTYSPIATSARNTSEVNDITNLTDEFAERIALALRVPAALMKGNVENTENARTDLVMYGVRPIAQMIEQEYNSKRLGRKSFLKGSRLFIDPLTIQLSDISNLPNFCERMTSCGQCSVDELREIRGEPLLGTPEAQKHYITKNYGLLEDPDQEAAGSSTNEPGESEEKGDEKE